MNKGYIALHRNLLEWEWYHDLPVSRLFIHLLLKANHKNHRYKNIIIKRGQYLIGRNNLALECNLSVQQLRTAIKKLKSTNEITIKTTNGYHLIEVVNYSIYQKNETVTNQQNNQQVNQPITNDQPTDNQRITTNNNVYNENNENNENNEEKEKAEFDFDLDKKRKAEELKIFWKAYIALHTPKGTEIENAELLAMLSEEYGFSYILSGTNAYIKECHATGTFTKSVAKFLEKKIFTGYDQIIATDKEETAKIKQSDDEREARVKKLTTINNDDSFFKELQPKLEFMGRWQKELNFCFVEKGEAFFLTNGKTARDWILREYKKTIENLFSEKLEMKVFAKEQF